MASLALTAKRTRSLVYGDHRNFVEIVDSPDQAAFAVTPRSEVLDMQITNGQHGRGCRKFRADLWPQLNPAIESGPQERKRALRHPLMFEAQISVDQRDFSVNQVS